MLGAVGEGRRDIVAGAGADDQHVFEGLAARIAIEQVDQGIVGSVFCLGQHGLMADVVGENGAGAGNEIDFVVGRPILDHVIGRLLERRIGRSVVGGEGRQADCAENAEDKERAPAFHEIQPESKRDGKPGEWSGAQIRRQGKGRDASEATANVGRVGLEAVAGIVKGAAHHLAHPTNVSAISAKKTAAMTSTGTTKDERSAGRYSVPK